MWKQKGLVEAMGESKQMNDLIESAGRRVRGVGSVRGYPTNNFEEKDSARGGGTSSMPPYQQRQLGHYSPPAPPVPPVRPSRASVATSIKVKSWFYGLWFCNPF